MKTVWIALVCTLVTLVVALLFWLSQSPDPRAGGRGPTTSPSTLPANTVRIGLIPERDIFEVHQRYDPLAHYLSERLGRPVQLVTVNTYQAVLKDFEERKVEAAFMGSLVAVLAMDRQGAKVLVKPELAGGSSTYCGVIFVKQDSPVRDLTGLAGRRLAMVRTTTAGNLCPCFLLIRHGLLNTPRQPRFVWVGTHDDVAQAVMEGNADAGAIKNQRLDALLAENADWKVRRLATGQMVPNNALLIRPDLTEALGPKLSQALLDMSADPDARDALQAMGVSRFLPCNAKEYGAIYDMVEALGEGWKDIGIEGPAPRRPGGVPAP